MNSGMGGGGGRTNFDRCARCAKKYGLLQFCFCREEESMYSLSVFSTCISVRGGGGTFLRS